MNDVAATSSQDAGAGMTGPGVAPAKPAREAGIEWLRVLACIAIVAFHANTKQWPVMIFGLEVFTIFTIALSVQSAGRRGPAEFVKGRAMTLLLPWVVWWLVYAAWKSLLAHRAGNDLFAWFAPWRLLAGPETHLWFLPFAFLATVAAGLWFGSHPPASDARIARRTAIAWSVVAALLLIAASAVMDRLVQIYEREQKVYQPWMQWCTVLPAVIMGLAIVRARVRGGYDNVALAMLWSVVIAAAGLSYALGWTNLALPYAIAISLCMVGLFVRHAASDTLLTLSGLTFGIFLLHPILFDVWYFVTSKIKLGPTFAVGTHMHAAAMTLFAVTVSAAIVWMLRKTPLRRVV